MVAVLLLETLDFYPRAEDEWDALVQLIRRDIEHPFASGARTPIGLLDDERDRISFIEQTQPSRHHGVLRVAWVHEHATAHQNPMRLGDERCDPAHVEILPTRARLASQAFVDVTLHCGFPEAAVRRIDRELARRVRNLQLRMRENELAKERIERERMRAGPDGEHQHG